MDDKETKDIIKMEKKLEKKNIPEEEKGWNVVVGKSTKRLKKKLDKKKKEKKSGCELDIWKKM